MASRYQGSSEGRPPPSRDRSPPRFPDRRPSSTYPPRSNDDAAPMREPPRGPKALVDQPRHSSFVPLGPRGRGSYGPRPEFRDRDRDFRDRAESSSFRRDGDRPDWSRRDREPLIRDSRQPISRDKSRSPPPISRRDISRASPPSVSDGNYLRRESKDFTPGPAPRDVPSSWNSRGGSFRGRGRGDWDGPRGRLINDRPGFRPRSRSRESWYDRDARDRDTDREADFDRRDRFERRDSDRPLDRDDRDKDSAWQRDRPPNQITPGGISASAKTPLATPSHPRSADTSATKPLYETGRRFSSSLTPTNLNTRKDGEKQDYFSAKSEQPSRTSIQRPVSPPSAPQVPAFGAPLSYLSTTTQPSAPVKPPSADKPLPPSKISSQLDGIVTNGQSAPPPMQPPTGPRAQRETTIPSQPVQKGPSLIASLTVQSKDEESRNVRPPTGPSATRTDVSAPIQSFQNVPSGPKARTSSASSLRSEPPTGPSTSPRMPFAASPRPFPVESPTASLAGIPTGPRAQRLAGPKQHQWVSKEYARKQQPSISQTVSPEQSTIDSRDKLVSVRRNSIDRESPVSPSNERAQRDRYQEASKARNVKSELVSPTDFQEKHDEDLAQHMESSQQTYELQEPVSDEEQDDFGLDEEDFEASEALFREEQQKREARKPPAPLDDAIVRNLLIRIQLLGMIAAQDIPPEFQKKLSDPESADIKMTGAEETDAPKQESPVKDDPMPVGRPLKEKPTVSTQTPSVEDLPFRNSGPPTPFSEFELVDEDLDKRTALQETFKQDFEKQKQVNAEKNKKLKEEFARYYKPWRMSVKEFDKKNEADKPLTPAPVSPPLSSVITTTAAKTPQNVERTRGRQNVTELDLQQIMKASEQEHREKEEARRFKEQKEADYEKEARIPPMVENFDRAEDNFTDTNRLISPENAIEVFAFVPPQDDFTDAEQDAFLTAFIEYPKKWGKIASFLPERDYQECIMHYYLTKDKARYKEALRRNQPRKGRRRGPSSRPKSNALMADLGVRPELYDGDEFDAAPAAVTDTGRPRRAAAPTFGENIATDENNTAGTTTKRGGGQVKDATAGEQPADKPAKSRKTGTGRQRKTKAQQAAMLAAAGQSPQKSDKETVPILKPGRPATKQELAPIPIEEPIMADHPITQELVPDLTHIQPMAMPTLDMEAHQNQLQGPYPQAQQPSSYWSVPEQKDFPKLLAHFGKDFDAISNYMRTKTAVMVKNFFGRQAEGKPELEEIAADADEKKRLGLPTAPLPIPVTAPKRKYDATPSAVVQRPLAPSTDTANIVEEVAHPALQRTLVDESTPSNQQMNLLRDAQIRQPLQSSAQPRAPPMPDPLMPVRTEEQFQPLRAPPLAQRPQQGPRSGFFAEERPDARQAVAGPQTQPNVQIAPTQSTDRMHVEPPNRHANLVPQQHASIASSAQPQYSIPTSAPSRQDFGPQLGNQTVQPVQSVSGMHHMRNLSAAGHGSPVQASLKHEEPVPLRRSDSQSYMQHYPPPPPQHSPAVRSSQPSHQAREPVRPSVAPATPTEPPKPTPAKRSNIMSILNDEPAEAPPPKRPSTELNRISAAHSPQPSLLHQQGHGYPHNLQPRREELPQGMQMGQQPQQSQHRGSYSAAVGQPMSMHSGQQMSDYGSGLGANSGPSPANRDWIARYDPRMSSQQSVPPPTAEPPPRMSQLPASPYASTIPPNRQESPRLNTSTAQPGPPASYHRMAPQHQQQQQPTHTNMAAPRSPPASLSHAGGPPYRSSSATSQHSRMSSYGQQQGPGLKSNNPPPQPIQGHPHSAGHSPLPSLQRQGSYPFDRGLTPNPAANYGPHSASQHHLAPQPQQSSQGQQPPSMQQPPPPQQQQRGYPGQVLSSYGPGPNGPPPTASGPPPPNRMFTHTPPHHYQFGSQNLHEQGHHHNRHYSQGGPGAPDGRR